MECFDAGAACQDMEFYSTDGLALVATRRGGTGGQVLLAHGFGQTRQSWGATQARLADAGLASLAWDMRAHGRSGRHAPDRPYLKEDFVADQVAAANVLGGRPVLVGASMGGLCGLLAQAAHDPFSALVLVDVTPRWEAAGMARIQGFMRAHPDGFADAEGAADAIAAYLPQRTARKSPGQLAHLLRTGADGRLRWHWDPRLLEGFVADSEHLQAPLADAARAVDVPVLLVSGGRSDLVSDATVAEFLALVPQARHVRLADATHMLAGDDNDAFTDTLLDFLRAHFATRAAHAAAIAPHAPPVAPGAPR